MSETGDEMEFSAQCLPNVLNKSALLSRLFVHNYACSFSGLSDHAFLWFKCIILILN